MLYNPFCIDSAADCIVFGNVAVLHGKNGMAVSYRGKNRQCDIYPCVYLSFALCLLWCVCAVTQVHGQGKESQKRKPEQSQCRTASHDKGQYRFEQSL